MGLFLEAGSGGLYRIARLLFEETKKIKRVHGTGNTAKAVVGRWIELEEVDTSGRDVMRLQHARRPDDVLLSQGLASVSAD